MIVNEMCQKLENILENITSNTHNMKMVMLLALKRVVGKIN